jgi:hypothetical protein
MIKVVAPDDADAAMESTGPAVPPQLPGHTQAQSADEMLNSKDYSDIEALIREFESQPQSEQAAQASALEKTRRLDGDTSDSLSSISPDPALQKTQPRPLKVKASEIQRPRSTASSPSTDTRESMVPEVATGGDRESLDPRSQIMVSEATRKRQKMLLLAAGGIATLLVLAGLGVVMMKMFGGTKTTQVANNEPNHESREPETPSDAANPQNDPVSPEDVTPQTPTNDVETHVEPDAIDPDNENNSRGAADANSEPLEKADDEAAEKTQVPEGLPAQPPPGLPLGTDSGGIKPQLPGVNSGDSLPGGNSNQTPMPRNDQAVAPSVAISDEKYQNVLSELAPLIAGADSSFEELSDLSAMDRGANIGLSEIYVARSDDLPKVDVAAILQTRYRRLKYDDAPLSKVLNDLSAISSLPIGYSIDAIRQTGCDPRRTVSIDAQDRTLVELVSELVGDGYHAAPQDWGLLIERTSANDPELARYKPPRIDSPTPEKLNRFVGAIRQIIQPTSWALPEFDIRFVDDEVELKHLGQVHYQVKTLIDRMDAANTVRQAGGNETTPYTPLFRAADERLDQKVVIGPGLPRSLMELADQAYALTELEIMIDWEALVQAGWSPQVEVPGFKPWSSVRDMLDDICDAMDLSYEVIDSHTVLLTTTAASDSRINVEVYPVGNLVNDQAPPDVLLSLLDQTIGAQLSARPNIQATRIYEAECNGLILLAPQEVQRAVSAVIDRLQSK